MVDKLAIVTAALAFAHFQIKRDAVTPIIGVALFTAGSMDAFHTLAADSLISATAANENQTVAEIDHALSRLEKGCYGISEESGEPIAYERLLVIPWTRKGLSD